MIPCFNAGSLPEDVQEELERWQSDLCYHGDRGCVFHVDRDDMTEIPLFLRWMVKEGAFTEDQIDLWSYARFQELSGRQTTNTDYYDYYKDYFRFVKDHNCTTDLQIAMTGT